MNIKRTIKCAEINEEPNKKRVKIEKNVAIKKEMETKYDETKYDVTQNNKRIKSENFHFKDDKFQEYLRSYFDETPMFDKMKGFCVGNDKHGNKLMVTYKSKNATLCSDILIKAMNTVDNMKNTKLTQLKYCTINYKCNCLDLNKIDCSFDLNLSNHSGMISKKAKPSVFIEILRNDIIIGKIYIITTKPTNLKRLSQAGTVKSYRMSITQNTKITHPGYINDFSISISKNNKLLTEFGFGIGYYIHHETNNIDLCLALLSIKNTKISFNINDTHNKLVLLLKNKQDSYEIFNSNKMNTYIQNSINSFLMNQPF